MERRILINQLGLSGPAGGLQGRQPAPARGHAVCVAVAVQPAVRDIWRCFTIEN